MYDLGCSKGYIPNDPINLKSVEPCFAGDILLKRKLTFDDDNYEDN